ncbi:MAG TPA: hypothetical protein VFL55_15200 [Acetobacteraceae bacterium]|nr:hypothetical protein [Acetobacteraceae bacterium]
MSVKAVRQSSAVRRQDNDRVIGRDDPREQLASLRSDLAYLRRQVHGLHLKLHGELAVLAVRIEDNERRAMQRRQVARRWLMATIVAAWLWAGGNAVTGTFSDQFLLPGLILAITTMVGGIALVVLILHNAADEQEHRDRHHNWFRLTTRDEAVMPPVEHLAAPALAPGETS